jgi:glycosyltransferase involved in cell wall biosynthesis
MANIALEIMMRETTVGEESGWEEGHHVVFQKPRTVDYRASVHDIANYLMDLMEDEKLRKKMGEAGRKRVLENYDYRVVAKKFVQIVSDKLGIS